jgi:hypothetical protein
MCVSVPDTFLDNLVATGSLTECHFLAENSLELLIGETNSPEKVLCKDASTELRNNSCRPYFIVIQIWVGIIFMRFNPYSRRSR